jgi:AcrR family transcriptional regulator
MISFDCHPSFGYTDTQMKSGRRQAYSMGTRADAMAASRDRIAHAMLQLALEQAYEDITLAAIAQAADVSHQTVLNHFDSKEGVAAAAAELLAQQTGEARAKARSGDVKGAIGVLVGEYERIGDANVRWAMSSERLGSLAPLLDKARAGHQAWLERVFSDSLPKAPAARRRAIHALHVSTDVYTWKLLRRDLKLSRTEVETIMVDLVSGILNAGSAARRSRSGRGAR